MVHHATGVQVEQPRNRPRSAVIRSQWGKYRLPAKAHVRNPKQHQASFISTGIQEIEFTLPVNDFHPGDFNAAQQARSSVIGR